MANPIAAQAVAKDMVEAVFTLKEALKENTQAVAANTVASEDLAGLLEDYAVAIQEARQQRVQTLHGFAEILGARIFGNPGR